MKFSKLLSIIYKPVIIVGVILWFKFCSRSFDFRYSTQLDNAIVDSVYYNYDQHNFPTIIMHDQSTTITLEYPVGFYWVDMVKAINIGDTLNKKGNSYTLYRKNNGVIDSFMFWDSEGKRVW